MLAALNFAHFSREERRKKILSYDNMCYLDNPKVAKRSHCRMTFRTVWTLVDGNPKGSIHIANHKDRQCQEAYNSKWFKKELNTMCCEQRFAAAWWSRVQCPRQCHITISIYIHRTQKCIHREMLYYARQLCLMSNLSPVSPATEFFCSRSSGISYIRSLLSRTVVMRLTYKCGSVRGRSQNYFVHA